jgi:hypothetical protein
MTDPIVAATRFLAEQMEWIRHHPAADEHLDVIERCVRRIRGVVDGPRPKKYLGPCGADLDALGIGPESLSGPYVPTVSDPCEGDVYGVVGGKTGTCRTCGAQVAQDERRAWLDDQVRDKAFRAAHIADAYGINVNTIRTWAARGHLVQHGIDRDLRPVYLVGDVLDLARAAAIRRAENEARRERATA